LRASGVEASIGGLSRVWAGGYRDSTRLPMRQANGGRVDRSKEERIARNNATFRQANERISAIAAEYQADFRLPFVCECADATCREMLRLFPEQYEEIRANSRHFLQAPGHDVADRGSAVIVAERDNYVIVEKTGHAGDVAEAMDERISRDTGEFGAKEE
jgi:hypothetical protein